MKQSSKKNKSRQLRKLKEEIDFSLIDANLKRTPTERAILHQNALELALALREAGRKYYDGLSRSHKATR